MPHRERWWIQEDIHHCSEEIDFSILLRPAKAASDLAIIIESMIGRDCTIRHKLRCYRLKQLKRRGAMIRYLTARGVNRTHADHDRLIRKRLVATVADPGRPAGNDHRPADHRGLGQPDRTVPVAQRKRNRRMRQRMSGGVRGRKGDPPPYSIGLDLSDLHCGSSSDPLDNTFYHDILILKPGGGAHKYSRPHQR